MNSSGLLLAEANEVRVVMFSIVLAIASAYSAFTLAKNAVSAPKNERKLWLAGTAGVIAVGIWAGRVILDSAFAASWRNAAIAAVVVSFFASAAATGVSDRRFLARALRRLSPAPTATQKEPEASKRTVGWWRRARFEHPTGHSVIAERKEPALGRSPADLLALGTTLRLAANSALAAGDLKSSSTAGESSQGLDEEAVQSEPSSTVVNSQLRE